MLRLNGVNFNMYFSSIFIAIGSLYMISYVGLLVIVQAFQVPSLTVPAAFSTLSLLYLFYMPSALIFSACASYMYDKEETARQFYPNIATTAGFITYTVVALVDTLADPHVASWIHYIFTALISYHIPFGGLYYINKVYVSCVINVSCKEPVLQDYLIPEIMVMFVFCFVHMFLYYIFLRITDSLHNEGSIKTLFASEV